MTKSVAEKGFRFPNTVAAVRWRQRWSRLRPNTGYSTNVERYPPPKLLLNFSTSTCGPPWTEVIETSGSVASMIRPNTVASTVVLLMNQLKTATQTRLNRFLSQHRRNTQMCLPQSSKLTPKNPCFHRGESSAEHMAVHAVRNDGLKAKQQKQKNYVNTGKKEKETTKQHLIAGPCIININPASSQGELWLQLMHEFDWGRNFG